MMTSPIKRITWVFKNYILLLRIQTTEPVHTEYRYNWKMWINEEWKFDSQSLFRSTRDDFDFLLHYLRVLLHSCLPSPTQMQNANTRSLRCEIPNAATGNEMLWTRIIARIFCTCSAFPDLFVDYTDYCRFWILNGPDRNFLSFLRQHPL